MNIRSIARQAVAEALRLRLSLGYGLHNAICVYDLAERLGIEVRFLELPSMEGMYYGSCDPHIVISSLRPPGRRAYTCAHEIGHHVRGDGTHVDELVEQRQSSAFNPSEFAADCFASALLMPKTAIERAFALRGWAINRCTPSQIYAVSNYFGVGYQTLIRHLRSGLSLLSASQADQLLRTTPRQAQALGADLQVPERVWLVDRNWQGRPIDVEQGDLILLKGETRVEGRCTEYVQLPATGTMLRARRPGIGRLEDNSGWAAFIRVSRRAFVGRSLYRHLEEAEDE